MPIERWMRLDAESLEGHMSRVAMNVQTMLAMQLAERGDQCEEKNDTAGSQRSIRRWATDGALSLTLMIRALFR